MKEINTTTVFGADISAYTDKAIAEAILALQEEQRRRARVRDYELVRKFKEAARDVFDANIPVHVLDHDEEEIYLGSVDNFFFDLD